MDNNGAEGMGVTEGGAGDTFQNNHDLIGVDGIIRA